MFAYENITDKLLLEGRLLSMTVLYNKNRDSSGSQKYSQSLSASHYHIKLDSCSFDITLRTAQGVGVVRVRNMLFVDSTSNTNIIL